MKKIVSVLVLVVFVFVSCATPVSGPQRNFTYPQSGLVNNASLAVKDFEAVGLIFVTSTEVIEGANRTGSRITYEMLMREAQNLGADDVINIRIDVNRREQSIRTAGGGTVTRITYNFSANALAIRYTQAVTGLSLNSQSLEQAMQAATQPSRVHRERRLGTGGVIAIVSVILASLIVPIAISAAMNPGY